MRSDVEHGDRAAYPESGSAPADAPPLWRFGSRIATRNVQTTRKAYYRYAETAERALNSLDSTASRVADDLWTMASAARETMVPSHGTASAHPAARRADALKAKVARGRTDVKDVVLRGQIAADTNVRAYLDHLEDLARAPSARKLASAQAAYFWDQWQRSLRQACDLQQRVVGALRKMASGSPA